MEFYEVMVNLTIGVIGGIFSGVIVSCVFLIQSVHSEQLSRVQLHFERVYGLDVVLFLFYNLLCKEDYSKNPGEKEKVHALIVEDIEKKVMEECASFRSMIFYDLDRELNTIAVALNDNMEKLRGIKNMDSDEVGLLHSELNEIQDRFVTYKSTSTKHFRNRVIKDKTLRILTIILIIIIAITIIA